MDISIIAHNIFKGWNQDYSIELLRPLASSPKHT